MLNMFSKMSTRPKMEVPLYESNLNVDELVNCMHGLDKYFDYEDIEKDNKVNYAMTRLKGHAILWWHDVQAERRRKGKSKIKVSYMMVKKLKGKFLAKHYCINIFKQLQNLK